MKNQPPAKHNRVSQPATTPQPDHKEEDSADILVQAQKGEDAPAIKEEPVTDGAPLGDMSRTDGVAQDVSQRRKPTPVEDPLHDGVAPKPRDVIDEDAPGHKLVVSEIVGRVATKPDVNEYYQILLSQDKVENPYATEQELVRLGYGISPRHDKEGNVIEA